LSINALKSLLGGSGGRGGSLGGSLGGSVLAIPGTPGVLARAMNARAERVEKEENEMYDYTAPGVVGGIGLGGLYEERVEPS
jgi:hypothetical protein